MTFQNLPLTFKDQTAYLRASFHASQSKHKDSIEAMTWSQEKKGVFYSAK